MILKRPILMHLAQARLLRARDSDLVDLIDKLGRLELIWTAFVEIGVDDRFNAAGPGRHHHNTFGKIHCLLYVVSHEDHRLRRPTPNPEQLALHQASGLRIECAKGLVHQ